MKKRLFTVLLGFVMVLSLIPAVAVYAADELATEGTPFAALSDAEDSAAAETYALTDEEIITVTVSETGQLQATLENMDGYVQEEVIALKLITEAGAFLNYADFTFIRESLPWLVYLDLSEADCLNDYDPSNPIEHMLPNQAMRHHKGLKTIILSNKISSIGELAFNECSNLRGDLVIPDNVTRIGKVAFGFWGADQSTFDSVTLSRNLEVMEQGVFLRAKIRSHVTIPASVRYLGGDGTYGGVFQETQLAGLTIEEGSRLEHIGDYCFNGASNMEFDFWIPESVTYIGGRAFVSCKSMTGELVLPPNLEYLGTSAFQGCTGLTGVVEFPASLATIGDSAFVDCTGITGVIFNEGLVTITKSAFQRCTSLVGDIQLPDSLETIGNSAFHGCVALDGELSFGSGIRTIGNNAFYDCSLLYGTLAFPETMDSIGNNAFYSCQSLTGLVLPERMNAIGSNAFYNCRSIVLDELVIPTGITSIPTKAFNSCLGINATITIPEGVTHIGEGAFYGTPIRGALVLPDTLETIDKEAFRNTQIESVHFGSGLKSIGQNQFHTNLTLTSISPLPEGLESIGANCFYGCTNLTGDIVFPSTLTSLGNYSFYNTAITSLSYHGDLIKDWSNTNLFGNLYSLVSFDFSDPRSKSSTGRQRPTTQTVH